LATITTVSVAFLLAGSASLRRKITTTLVGACVPLVFVLMISALTLVWRTQNSAASMANVILEHVDTIPWTFLLAKRCAAKVFVPISSTMDLDTRIIGKYLVCRRR
jgi:hypothetical protein